MKMSLSFFFFWPCRMACGLLVPQPEIEPWPLAVRAPRPIHWSARESPKMTLKWQKKLSVLRYREGQGLWEDSAPPPQALQCFCFVFFIKLFPCTMRMAAHFAWELEWCMCSCYVSSQRVETASHWSLYLQ